MSWQFTLYGSDEHTGTGFPAKSTVEGLSDVESVTFSKVLGLYPQLEVNSEKSEYLGGYKTVDKNSSLTFSLKIYPKDFPQIATSLDDFYSIPILTKKYHYLLLPSDYYLLPEEIKTTPTTYTMEVIVTGFTIEHQDPEKYITIELERAYNE